MIVSFATQAVQVLRPALITDHGTVVPDYSSLETLPLSQGWVVQPQGSGEDLDGRQLTTADRLLLGPPGADIRRHDLVQLPGATGTWRVREEPAPWPSPTGALAHTQVVVTRHTEGA